MDSSTMYEYIHVCTYILVQVFEAPTDIVK